MRRNNSPGPKTAGEADDSRHGNWHKQFLAPTSFCILMMCLLVYPMFYAAMGHLSNGGIGGVIALSIALSASYLYVRTAGPGRLTDRAIITLIGFGVAWTLYRDVAIQVASGWWW